MYVKFRSYYYRVILFSPVMYLCRVNNRNTRTTPEFYSNLTKKTPKRLYGCSGDVVIVNFGQILRFVLVFSLLKFWTSKYQLGSFQLEQIIYNYLEWSTVGLKIFEMFWVVNDNVEHISHLVLVFLLLALNK